MDAAIKFALVAVAATLLAFGIGHLSYKVPGVRVILGTTPEKRDPAPRLESVLARHPRR
jgi:hypothetical protein